MSEKGRISVAFKFCVGYAHSKSCDTKFGSNFVDFVRTCQTYKNIALWQRAYVFITFSDVGEYLMKSKETLPTVWSSIKSQICGGRFLYFFLVPPSFTGWWMKSVWSLMSSHSFSCSVSCQLFPLIRMSSSSLLFRVVFLSISFAMFSVSLSYHYTAKSYRRFCC